MALPAGVTELGQFKGAKGDKGDTGTFASATATTLAAGASATVAISGPESAKVVEFGIPRGNTGATGSTGATGPAGTITGATASALAEGATPTVSLGGTSTARTFAFGIPRGATGAQGPQGVKGDPGDATTPATTSANGVVRLATQAEALAGTVDAVVTAATAKAAIDAAKPVDASATLRGLVELATNAETIAGTAAGAAGPLAVTPPGLVAFEAALRPVRNRVVVVGSSNAAGGSTPANMWPSKLCAIRGWTLHDYAIAGSAYTNTNNFDAQVQNAINGMSAAQRAEVLYFFVCDASNNSRAKTPSADVLAAATQTYSRIRDWFVNATIVVIPQIWPSDTQKYAPSAFPYETVWNAFAVAHAEAQREALRAFPRSLFIDESWTWLTGLDQFMTALNDVHPNADGMTVIANYINRALLGESPVGAQAWTDAVPTSGRTLGGRGRNLASRRRGWDVWTDGSVTSTAAITASTSSPVDIATVAYGARPTFNTPLAMLRGDTFAPVPAELWPNGAVRIYASVPANVAMWFSAAYELG